MNLSKNTRISIVGDPVVAGSSIDDNSDRLDMSGWDGVVFVAPITDSVATGVATLTVQQNTADSDTGMASLAGAVAAATCAVNDDLNGKALLVDVSEPRERYVQAVRTSATANIAYGNVVAIQYRAVGKLPASEAASIAASALAVSPAES